MAVRQVAPVMCPVCGARFTTPIESIVDVSNNPQLKGRFLQGRINIAQCPQCGTQAPMTAPLLYHDSAHQLALVFMPHELNLHHNDQQRMIGDLTNTLMNRLPPEQRKAYLLTPKTFFTMQSLINAVLEAEGITPEMLERQRAKAQLITEFLQAGDEESLRKLVKQHDAELDYEFFQILTASAEATQADGQPEMARALLGLRTLLATWSSQGREAVAHLDASLEIGESVTREDILQRLQSAQSDIEFEMVVAGGRPLLDYAFFQNLTAQIEGAPDAETATRLKALRTRILDTTTKQDEDARAAMQRASDLLRAILEAEDPRAVARQRLDEVNDAFFILLSANLQRAEAEKRPELAQALQKVADMVLALLEDRLPPEVRLINQLLNASYPEGSRQLLEAQRQILSEEFLAALDQLVAELEKGDNATLANHMRQVRSQAELLSRGVVQP